jgi:hypothetical protein
LSIPFPRGWGSDNDKKQYSRGRIAPFPDTRGFASLFTVSSLLWSKPQNNISKMLNQNDNENKTYGAINVPFIEWGMASE